MDANSKVKKYLAGLGQESEIKGQSGSWSSTQRVTTSGLQTVRGPGQASHDPLQFVTTSGISLAENARQIISTTEQQKRQREKLIESMPRFSENESWQEDLDTWRKKRKNKAWKTETIEERRKYNSLPNYGSRKKHFEEDSKEEILTIRSPIQEDHNDSGIENRTSNSHSPSTSLDFSPRSDSKLSTDYISPKNCGSIHKGCDRSTSPPPPAYAPPPPPPQAAVLDQVLIPVQVSHTTPTTYQKAEDEDYPPPPVHVRRSVEEKNTSQEPFALFESGQFPNNRSQVSASFQRLAITKDNLVKPFAVQTIKETSTQNKEADVELTVELNREQKAQVSATKFTTTRIVDNPRSTATDVSPIGQYTQLSSPFYTSRLNHSTSTPNISHHTRAKNMTSTTLYRTVDIPFESPASYQPKKDKDDALYTIVVVMGTQPVHKGLGFSIVNERGWPTVDSVIVGTPADRAGLLVGDRVISINGEELKDKYPSAISRILHEAARLGEAELKIEKKNDKILYESSHSIDKARLIFSEKSIDSYAEFKRKHSRASRIDAASLPSTRFCREYNSLPRTSSTANQIYGPIRRDNSASSYRSTPESANSSSFRSAVDSTGFRSDYSNYSSDPSADYRVSSLHEKIGPGKLTDFIPEVERATDSLSKENKREPTIISHRSGDEPLLIRNYDLPPTHNSPTRITNTTVNLHNNPEIESVSAILKRSTLPRNPALHQNEQVFDNDIIPGKSYIRKNLRHLSLSPIHTNILKKTSDIYHSSDDVSLTSQLDSREIKYNNPNKLHSRYHSVDEFKNGRSNQRRKLDYYSAFDDDQDQEHDSDPDMYRKKEFHTVGIYGTEKAIIVSAERYIPIYNHSYKEEPQKYQFVSSKFSNNLPQMGCVDNGEVSGITYRFYDRAGNFVNIERGEDYGLDIKRDYDATNYSDNSMRKLEINGYAGERNYREDLTFEEMEKKLWIPDEVDPCDWRDVINQQRQAVPGQTTDKHKIKEASASLGLPAIIGRKLEESRRSEREKCKDYPTDYRSVDKMHDQPTETYKRTKYGRFEKSFNPTTISTSLPNTHFNNLRYPQASEVMKESSNYASDYNRRGLQTMNHKEPATNYKKEVHREPENKDQVLAVSGKHRCAHCAEELGRGAAMIVESLNLFYHLACFKCYVCKTPLGSGATGADVRVREGRLHCQSCYSNDRVQLSKV